MSDKNIESIVNAQRVYFQKGETKDLDFRLRQLGKLRKAVKKYEKEILAALKTDLNKPRFEAYGTEIGLVLEEAAFAIKHLKAWASPKKVRTSILNFPSTSRILTEPYGVTLIMSPWNYPVLLTLDPLIGAIAAGNCAVLKPSNYSPHVSALLKKMIEEIFPPKYVAVIEGGRNENQALLDQTFDMIFFTGSVAVGKKVMEAAAKNLTPVCLELGGKSPCIVDETANLDLAARRIVWGKYLNAGQTCVAPDYLLVQKSVKDRLLEKIVFYIRKYYGESAEHSEEFPRIVNEKHFNRLLGLMDSGEMVFGGGSDRKRNQIGPVVLDQAAWDSPVMQEEIFGPILPVLTFERLKDAVELIKERTKPLACYFFTSSKKNEQYLLKQVSFGGGCINDTVMHLASTHMPFGGVGNSGMGGYHGKDSFLIFSHRKSILKKAQWLDMPFRYPPYKGLYYRIMKLLLK